VPYHQTRIPFPLLAGGRRKPRFKFNGQQRIVQIGAVFFGARNRQQQGRKEQILPTGNFHSYYRRGKLALPAEE
jgi:hypothetical protein